MFELSEGLYCIADIQNYFEYIIKKYQINTLINNYPKKIYTNRIKNRIVFKMKTWYKLKLQTQETINFLGNTEKDISTAKNWENVSKLETTEVMLLYCNILNINY